MEVKKKSVFEGCWETQWADCNSKGKLAGSTRLVFKTDALNPKKITGAWTGTEMDSAGFKHCGFITGEQMGNEVRGTWYEVLYKNSQTCPLLSYSGTFHFVLVNGNSFKGTWTDKNGACKNWDTKMGDLRWDGERVV